jgi:hypothetical protein
MWRRDVAVAEEEGPAMKEASAAGEEEDSCDEEEPCHCRWNLYRRHQNQYRSCVWTGHRRDAPVYGLATGKMRSCVHPSSTCLLPLVPWSVPFVVVAEGVEGVVGEH